MNDRLAAIQYSQQQAVFFFRIEPVVKIKKSWDTVVMEDARQRKYIEIFLIAGYTFVRKSIKPFWVKQVCHWPHRLLLRSHSLGGVMLQGLSDCKTANVLFWWLLISPFSHFLASPKPAIHPPSSVVFHWTAYLFWGHEASLNHPLICGIKGRENLFNVE